MPRLAARISSSINAHHRSQHLFFTYQTAPDCLHNSNFQESTRHTKDGSMLLLSPKRGTTKRIHTWSRVKESLFVSQSRHLGALVSSQRLLYLSNQWLALSIIVPRLFLPLMDCSFFSIVQCLSLIRVMEVTHVCVQTHTLAYICTMPYSSPDAIILISHATECLGDLLLLLLRARIPGDVV
jgi:hypothetical protein